ncbi:MAG: CaiB/BaiF CoA-transferase family protein [Acidobacteriota bacterium]
MTVVDLSRYLPGPLVGRLLADLGARVIKVEEPKLGDPSRQAPPFVENRSSLATLLLAGHESVALDFKKPLAKELLEELLMSADVLVESFRPGTLEKVGLGAEELRSLFPSLIVCSVTGWGQDGDYAWRAGHDLGYQAIAGTLAAGGGMPAVQVADLVGGWSAALAVSSALHRRALTGHGCWIDQSLLDAAGHSALTAWAAEADGAKKVAEPLMLTGAIPCYDLYRTRDDGTLALAALEPKFWRRFCQHAGRKDLVLKQFSADPSVRRQVAELVATKTREEWAAFMTEYDIPAEPVLAPHEALEHPQVQVRELARRGDDGLLRLGYPAKFDGERPRGGAELAAIGEHTDAVLKEFSLGGAIGSFTKRRGGVGQRFSFRRWAGRVAGRIAAKRHRDSD